MPAIYASPEIMGLPGNWWIRVHREFVDGFQWRASSRELLYFVTNVADTQGDNNTALISGAYR